MVKYGRAHEVKERMFRVNNTRQEQVSASTMGPSAKISTTINEIKDEKLQIPMNETVKKSNVPQYSNGTSMLTLIQRQFNYFPPVEITTTRRH